jgi:hypothetical protein
LACGSVLSGFGGCIALTFEQLACPFQLAGQRFFAWQSCAILGGEDRAREALQGKTGDACAVLGAENQANRPILIGSGPMMAGVLDFADAVCRIREKDS